VAIDIGSNSIKLAVAKNSLDDQDKVQVLALVERPSSGIKRGVVTSMTEATEALIEVVAQAEGVVGLPIKRSVFGINGTGISFVNSEGLVVISRQDNEIQEEDVERVIQDSLTKAFGVGNNEIIHIIPKAFKVDNQSGIRYPVGMLGNKLEAKTLIISVETSFLRNFSKVINQSGVEISDQIFTPLASSNFLFSTRQKKSGTMLVDIGYSSTSYILWENEEIFASGVIPVGSEHITADLAVGLQTTIEMAEEIKKQHVDLSDGAVDELEEIEMYNPDLQINETFKLSDIRDFARARTEEIFIYINRELQKIGKKGKLPGGVILIGGGSALKGIDDVARYVLKLAIFKYHFDPKKIEFLPDYNGDPAFINSIALAAYYLFHSEEISYSKASKNNFSARTGVGSGGGEGRNTLNNMFKKIWPWG
jgi:cell division protein FtsA